MWVNGTLVNASIPDPLGLAENRRLPHGQPVKSSRSVAGKMAEVVFLRDVDANHRNQMEGIYATVEGITASTIESSPSISLPKESIP